MTIPQTALTATPAARAGDLLIIEAPNGESVEGRAVADVPDFDVVFYVTCEETGERLRVNQPWNCEIEVVGS